MCVDVCEYFLDFWLRDFRHFAMVNFAEGQVKRERNQGKVFEFLNYFERKDGGRGAEGRYWPFVWPAK